ncbi:ABC transporter ATP-binding protein [Anaerocolumna sp.]|uniref:ABC transporter ATP-binding protein n=1 Tax=Anaerocolumna sp. TaxID=2041569 RepID=UPI0028ACFAB4|nr:ATP-binding cassette domain-containing protein [Anaerocolumna sp.]
MIQVEHISKTFQVARRNAGFAEAFKALFNKQYEYVKALDDLSFTINDGEMVGYIGPNGAGKSSTIKILSGILTPDSGTCLINGRTPWKNRVAHVQDIGVVFGQRTQLWWDVPVIDSFELLRDIYKIPSLKYKDKLEELITLLNLEKIIKTPTRQLSLGQRMRCEIAASLLHDPKILFLDEPTIGLDAVSKIAVRNFILDMNNRHKTTVILTTHDMQDIEALTKRIILIGKGKILLDGSLQDMKKRFAGHKKLILEYEGPNLELCNGMVLVPDETGVASKKETEKVYKPGIYDSVKKHSIIDIDTEKIQVSEAIGKLSAQVDIKDISISEASIDEVVVKLYKEYEI